MLRTNNVTDEESRGAHHYYGGKEWCANGKILIAEDMRRIIRVGCWLGMVVRNEETKDSPIALQQTPKVVIKLVTRFKVATASGTFPDSARPMLRPHHGRKSPF